MFQIKDFISIAASMVNYAKATQSRVTDFTVGSVARTLLEAPAIEIEELYQQMWLGLKEAIPTAVYDGFGFTRLLAESAQGSVTVSITVGPSLTIPAGTRFVADTLATSFLSTDDVIIAAGATNATLRVSAETPGVAQAVLQNDSFTAAIPRFIGAVAASGFIQGSNEETDAARKRRFIGYLQNIARSPVQAVQYGLTTVAVRDSNGSIVEAVKHAAVEERFLINPAEPAGIIYCHIHNGVNGASAALIAEAEQILHGHTDANGNKITGWKAAGIQTIVQAVGNIAVNVAAIVTVTSGLDAVAVKNKVSAAISQYITDTGIGAPVLRAEIIAAAMSIEGVVNFNLTSPVADIAPGSYQKATPGVYELT